MIEDPYAELRAECLNQLKHVNDHLMAHYRPLFDQARTDEARANLHRELRLQVEAYSAPITKILATVPPPPVVFTAVHSAQTGS